MKRLRDDCHMLIESNKELQDSNDGLLQEIDEMRAAHSLETDQADTLKTQLSLQVQEQERKCA